MYMLYWYKPITTSLKLAQTHILLSRIFSDFICNNQALWCNKWLWSWTWSWNLAVSDVCENYWCMTNGSKFEPREQMNRALKPGGVKSA